ncbi:hypothetical protein [Desulfovirgula thermocuniculi]|uniref:hypothetical protein n=1 Tax=Desulfovirgula thermocuniculi TaxID=348842 RepID=UPI001B7FC899|nr:hypothetical protein [Desulfovirgula thermocuniculi]
MLNRVQRKGYLSAATERRSIFAGIIRQTAVFLTRYLKTYLLSQKRGIPPVAHQAQTENVEQDLAQPVFEHFNIETLEDRAVPPLLANWIWSIFHMPLSPSRGITMWSNLISDFCYNSMENRKKRKIKHPCARTYRKEKNNTNAFRQNYFHLGRL